MPRITQASKVDFTKCSICRCVLTQRQRANWPVTSRPSLLHLQQLAELDTDGRGVEAWGRRGGTTIHRDLELGVPAPAERAMAPWRSDRRGAGRKDSDSVVRLDVPPRCRTIPLTGQLPLDPSDDPAAVKSGGQSIATPSGSRSPSWAPRPSNPTHDRGRCASLLSIALRRRLARSSKVARRQRLPPPPGLGSVGTRHNLRRSADGPRLAGFDCSSRRGRAVAATSTKAPAQRSRPARRASVPREDGSPKPETELTIGLARKGTAPT
jgi:hypothetical protein